MEQEYEIFNGATNPIYKGNYQTDQNTAGCQGLN